MKKRLSRFLAFMLVLCMVMTMVPAAFADSNEVQILFLDSSLQLTTRRTQTNPEPIIRP